jgi:hypothetical protein
MDKDTKYGSEIPMEELPRFPLDKFPQSIYDLIHESREKKNFPIEITASAILTAVGASIGNSLRIRTPEYEDKAITWTGIIAPRGTMKTHAINRALKPFAERVSRKYKEHEKELQIWEDLGREGKKPQFISALIHDSTIEGIYKALEHNPHGVLTHADELTTWIGNFSRYTGGDDSGGYNSLFNGNMFNYNRKNTERSLYLENPFWSVIGGLQPNLLGYLFGGDRIESGFFDRIQFVFPQDIRFFPMNGDPMYSKKWDEYDSGINLILNEALDPGNWTYLRIADLQSWKDRYNALGMIRNGLSENDPRRGLSAKAQTMFSRWSIIAHGLNVAFNGKGFKENITKEEIETAYSLTNYFYKTGLYAYERVTNASPVDTLSDQKRLIYERIPHGLEFSRKDAVKILEDLKATTKSEISPFKMSVPTLDRFLAQNKFFRLTSYGNYLKIL